MHSSVLSLLFLFASVICASPVHIGRRMDRVQNPQNLQGVQDGPAITIGATHEQPEYKTSMEPPVLSPQDQDNSIYERYRLDFLHYGKPVPEVPGALKIPSKDDTIIVRIVVKEELALPVERMIYSLGPHLLSWKWSDIGNKKVAVTIHMKEDGERIVIEHLKPGSYAGLTAAMGHVSLGHSYLGES